MPKPVAEARIGSIGVVSIVLVTVYGIALHSVFRHEQQAMRPAVEEAEAGGTTLRTALIQGSASAVVVVAAGLWLPVVAEGLAVAHGLSDGLVGTLLVAATTSLPEFTVTLAALRIGALDMAFANLLGSNLFDMVVLAVDDLVHTDGPLLAVVSPVHAATALSAIMMNAVVIVALLRRPRRRILGTVGWTSLTLLAISLLNAWILVSAER